MHVEKLKTISLTLCLKLKHWFTTSFLQPESDARSVSLSLPACLSVCLLLLSFSVRVFEFEFSLSVSSSLSPLSVSHCCSLQYTLPVTEEGL